MLQELEASEHVLHRVGVDVPGFLGHVAGEEETLDIQHRARLLRKALAELPLLLPLPLGVQAPQKGLVFDLIE